MIFIKKHHKIFITGDCHADFRKFSTENFPEQINMTRDDFVIVCGDFGIWHDTASERWWFDWLSEKPFTVLFVDGNHENFDRLMGGEFEVVDFHGGKAHKIRENIYHLMRGYVFELCGKHFFAFGGAQSHDIGDGIVNESDYPTHRDFLNAIRRMTDQGKMFRINHLSWWKEEMPSGEEYSTGDQSLQACGWNVDYIITHCAPTRFLRDISDDYEPDELTTYLDVIEKNTKYKGWFCGHYHQNRSISKKFHILYHTIEAVM